METEELANSWGASQVLVSGVGVLVAIVCRMDHLQICEEALQGGTYPEDTR